MTRSVLVLGVENDGYAAIAARQLSWHDIVQILIVLYR